MKLEILKSITWCPTWGSSPRKEKTPIKEPRIQDGRSTKEPEYQSIEAKGNVANWTTFWDSFQSVIHNNKDINDVDKFNSLNSILEGAASRAIKGLTISEANYKSAMKILNERFGKTQHIISAQVKELMKLQPSQNDRPASLRFIYDMISVHDHWRFFRPIWEPSDPNNYVEITKLYTIDRKSSKDVWE